METAASVDSADVARFDAIGEDWWNPAGSMRALHQINPIRLGWLRDLMIAHFELQSSPAGPGPQNSLFVTTEPGVVNEQAVIGGDGTLSA